MEEKTIFKYSSKDLRFLPILTFFPKCWLQLHNNKLLLAVSDTWFNTRWHVGTLCLKMPYQPSVSQTHWEQRCAKHTVPLLTMEAKQNFKYSSKYLAFLVHGENRNESIMILLRVECFYLTASCSLQFKKLLVSKTATVLEQERANASIDTGNIPLVIFFTWDFDNRGVGLWMMKLIDWIVKCASFIQQASFPLWRPSTYFITIIPHPSLLTDLSEWGLPNVLGYITLFMICFFLGPQSYVT